MPLAKPGGFRRLAGFHIGLYFWESACCEIPQSRRRPPGAPRPCQLPFAREPLGCGDEAPLAKGGCLGSAEAGGFHRVAVFHIGLYFQEVPTVNPSVKNQRFLPAPFSKGAFWRPVSFYCAIPGFYRLSIDSVGNKHSKNPQTQTGAETETHHPSQSEGSISRWFHPGDSQGGSELFPP